LALTSQIEERAANLKVSAADDPISVGGQSLDFQ